MRAPVELALGKRLVSADVRFLNDVFRFCHIANYSGRHSHELRARRPHDSFERSKLALLDAECGVFQGWQLLSTPPGLA